MHWRKTAVVTLGVTLLVGAATLWHGAAELDAELHTQRTRLEVQTLQAAPGAVSVAVRVDWAQAGLPPPVARYLQFAFPQGAPATSAPVVAQMQMAGRFRRPRTEGFTPTTARQLASSAVPALVFDATTELLGGVLWARAWDAYVEGRMRMQARVLSAVTVLDEFSSPELDRISLRRWLLESPLYPQALLPGGWVTWEAVDLHSARAVARWGGLEAKLLARFGPDGSLQSMEAEEDGDLNTPYHGSGEHVVRSRYRLVDGVNVPMHFVISRRAGGVNHPFWEGDITSLELRPATAAARPTI